MNRIVMEVPFAACKGGPHCPWCLLNHVGGIPETCAPVSTRNRRPVLSSVIKKSGPAVVDATVGPLWYFPGSFCVRSCTWDSVADISSLFHRTFGGTNRLRLSVAPGLWTTCHHFGKQQIYWYLRLGKVCLLRGQEHDSQIRLTLIVECERALAVVGGKFA